MPKILDDQLFTLLTKYEEIKANELKFKKQAKKLREELDMKLGDYDSGKIEVGNMAYAEDTNTPLYLVKYTPQETRKIVREKLIEKGVSLKVLLYATEVTQSRRLIFKRSEG